MSPRFMIGVDKEALHHADFATPRWFRWSRFQTRQEAFLAVEEFYQERPIIECEPPIFYTYYSRPYADALKRNVWHFKRLWFEVNQIELIGSLQEFVALHCEVKSYPSNDYLHDVELSLKIIQIP